MTSLFQSSIVRQHVCCLVFVAFFSLSLGCTHSPDSESVRTDAGKEAAAKQLLAEVIGAYAAADRYHDDAKIVVRYRLDGRPMEEHQLWAIDFQRPGHVAARLFNARIQTDRNRTTAMVFDFDSENMDSQYLVLGPSENPPWPALFSDPVCRHFISGSSEIPFNPKLVSDLNLPPTIGLLLGNPPVDWMLHPDRVELLDDATCNGANVRRIRIEREGRTFELWIDPATKRLVQATLPNHFLDPALLVSPEITELQLSVQFNEGTFEPNWEQSPFSTELPDTANPVSRFVPLPDPFPSELIGKPMPSLTLSDRSGESIRWTPPQTTAIIAWVDRTDTSRELIQQLQSIADRMTDEKIAVQLCYLEFPDPNPNAVIPSDLTQFIHDSGIRLPIAADVGLAAGQTLDVKFAPTVLVLDANGLVQFFQAIALAEWKTKLSAAIERVAQGESLASEMRADYAKFIEEYKNQLQQLNPLKNPSSQLPAQSVARHSLTPANQPGKPAWTNAELKQPGNVLVIGSNQAVVNDGWQTIAVLDLDSQSIERHALALAPENSATILRPSHSEPRRYAAFAEMGQQVLLLSEVWGAIGRLTYPENVKIRDVQLADTDGDGADELWILQSDGLLVARDEKFQTKPKEIPIEQSESFIAIRKIEGSTSAQFLVVRSDGGVVPISEDFKPQTPFAFGSLKIKRLLAVDSSDLLACATALDPDGSWVAIGINRDLEVAWTRPIGPQEFESQIQPIAMNMGQSRRRLAFAGSDNTITIVSTDGELVDSIAWPSPLRGLAWTEIDDVPALIVSDEARLSATSLPGD